MSHVPVPAAPAPPRPEYYDPAPGQPPAAPQHRAATVSFDEPERTRPAPPRQPVSAPEPDLAYGTYAQPEPEPVAAAAAEGPGASPAAAIPEPDPAAGDEATARPRQGAAAKKTARGRRSSVPSWDEIMLGSSRQRD